MTKTHWLYGFGPNKEVKFNKEVDVESNCYSCLHKEVCSYALDKRCVNFELSNSGGQQGVFGCANCIHRYTRFDADNPITCFHCNEYLPNDKIVQFLNQVEVGLFLKNILLKTRTDKELIQLAIYDFKKENNIEKPFENDLCLDIMKQYVINSVIGMMEKRKKKPIMRDL